MFLYDKTNKKIDIVKTVTDEKVVFMVFDIPPKSMSLFSDRAQPNARHILVKGSIKTSKNLSIIFIKRIIDPFVTIAVEILPHIVSNVSIKGIKALIILHKSSI